MTKIQLALILMANISRILAIKTRREPPKIDLEFCPHTQCPCERYIKLPTAKIKGGLDYSRRAISISGGQLLHSENIIDFRCGISEKQREFMYIIISIIIKAPIHHLLSVSLYEKPKKLNSATTCLKSL